MVLQNFVRFFVLGLAFLALTVPPNSETFSAGNILDCKSDLEPGQACQGNGGLPCLVNAAKGKNVPAGGGALRSCVDGTGSEVNCTVTNCQTPPGGNPKNPTSDATGCIPNSP